MVDGTTYALCAACHTNFVVFFILRSFWAATFYKPTIAATVVYNWEKGINFYAFFFTASQQVALTLYALWGKWDWVKHFFLGDIC